MRMAVGLPSERDRERVHANVVPLRWLQRLFWYEEFAWLVDAIAREKAIKSSSRAWKVELIEATNPHWRDLYPHLVMF
jgi:predicted GIY-YIG superfamily endonuclease